MYTLEEVTLAIAEQEKLRDQALGQANFHTGCLSVLKNLQKHLEGQAVTKTVKKSLSKLKDTKKGEEWVNENQDQ